MSGPVFYPSPDDDLAQTPVYMQRMVADIDRLLGAKDIIGFSWNGPLNSGGACDIDLTTKFSAVHGAVVQLEAGTTYPPRMVATQANAPAGHLYVIVFKNDPVKRDLKTGDSWPYVGASNEWVTLRMIIWGAPK